MIVKTKQQVCTAINSLFVQLTLRADPPMSLVLSMIGNFSTSKAVCVEQKLIFFLSHLSAVFIYAGNNFFAGGPIKLDVV